MFKVFGFYKFIKVKSLKKNKDFLQKFLISNHIRGTIIVAKEGLNGTISGSIKKIDKSFLFNFELPKKERKHLIEKASICVNGISLTISKVTKKGFQIWIIPHTYKETNLSTLKKSSLVNIEIDILSKYVRNYFNGKK